MPLVSCVTPTIGRASLERCMRSVRLAAEKAGSVTVEHIITLDGPDHGTDSVRRLVDEHKSEVYQPFLLVLPYPTKRAGAVIRSIVTPLCRGEFVHYLDDDNMLTTQFYLTMLAGFESHHLFAFCLRKVFSSCEGTGINNGTGYVWTVDRAESLGPLSSVWRMPSERFIDTNLYFMRTTFAKEVATFWSLAVYNSSNPEWGDDRAFYSKVIGRCSDPNVIAPVPMPLVVYEAKLQLLFFHATGRNMLIPDVDDSTFANALSEKWKIYCSQNHPSGQGEQNWREFGLNIQQNLRPAECHLGWVEKAEHLCEDV